MQVREGNEVISFGVIPSDCSCASSVTAYGHVHARRDIAAVLG